MTNVSKAGQSGFNPPPLQNTEVRVHVLLSLFSSAEKARTPTDILTIKICLMFETYFLNLKI